MKAIVQDRYGSHEHLQLQEVEKPVAGEEEVLVRVCAASIHPDVWHVVTGRPVVLRLMGGGLLRPKNRIPGTDMAGIVDAVGRRVTRFKAGDAVFGETTAGQQWVHGGAYAEYVAVPQHLLAVKPGNVTFEEAASVPTSGYIALQNLRDRTKLGPGREVLINGAGGGVGTLAVQIAKSHGAHVTAVDSAGKLDMLRTLGADEVIDFEQDDFLTRGVRYDLIFDVPGQRPFSVFNPALKPDGRYVPIGHEHYGASGRRLLGLIPHFLKLILLSRFVTHLRGPGIPLPTKEEAIMALRDLLEEGTITPIIDSAYPLHEVREAFRHMTQDQLSGKVMLVLP